ncbi:precorrin-6A reductase [Paradesulfitobacterium aromaticivorans]
MIFLVGETAAARELGERLLAQGIPSLKIETHNDKFRLLAPQGKRDGDLAELLSWIPSFDCTVILDASHPSCSARFGKVREYCEQQGIPFLRLDRPETVIPANPLIHTVGSWEQALDKLGERVLALNKAGPERKVLSGASKDLVTVFVTTGSHQIDSLVQSPFASKARFVVRVLPEGRLVQKCQDLGIAPRDIVAMQGPFSKELNRMLFKFYGADIVFTRDSGPAGGTDTKISAALALGLEVVVLKRAAMKQGLTAHSVKEVLEWVKEDVR